MPEDKLQTGMKPCGTATPQSAVRGTEVSGVMAAGLNALLLKLNQLVCRPDGHVDQYQHYNVVIGAPHC